MNVAEKGVYPSINWHEVPYEVKELDADPQQ
jgi:hypothetical protein